MATADQALWLRQLGAVLVVELRRTLWTRRAAPLWLLAGVPVVATLLATLFAPQPKVFQNIFTTLVVGVGVFFGTAVAQTKLLRGEIVAHTLHYHLLSPISRDVLLVGKYLAGFAGTSGVFAAVTVVCHGAYAFLGVELSSAGNDGPPPLATQLAVVVLGCAAYGALFLLFGTLFRNPVLPVAGLLGWELLQFFLPPVLKALSVAHYLQGLLGEAAATQQAAFGDDSTLPAWACALVLSGLAAGAVALACHRLRRLEAA